MPAFSYFSDLHSFTASACVWQQRNAVTKGRWCGIKGWTRAPSVIGVAATHQQLRSHSGVQIQRGRDLDDFLWTFTGDVEVAPHPATTCAQSQAQRRLLS